MGFLQNLNKENIGTMLIGLGILAAFYILSPLFSYTVIKIFNFKKNKKEIKNNPLYIPIKAVLRIIGIYITIMYLKEILNFDETAIYWTKKLFKIMLIVTFANGFANSITEKSNFVKKYKERTEKDIDSTTVIFATRVIKIVIYIFAVAIIAKELGYDLNGVITGLGIRKCCNYTCRTRYNKEFIWWTCNILR